MEIICSEKGFEPLVFNNGITSIEKANKYFKILSSSKNVAGDFYSYKIKKEDETECDFSDLKRLLIRIKNFGIVNVYFDDVNLDLPSMVEKIKVLKEIEIIDIKTRDNKILSLLTIINEYKPLFVSFYNNDKYEITLDELSDLFTFDFGLFFLSGNYKKVKDKEEKIKIKKEKPKKINKEKEPTTNQSNLKTRDDFTIKKNRDNLISHILLYIIIILGTAITLVSIFKIFDHDNLAFLYLTFGIISNGVSGYIILDVLTEQKKIWKKVLISTLVLLGLVLGGGLFFGIKELFFKTENIIDIKNVFLIGYAIVLLTPIVGAIVFIIKDKKKKKKLI